MAASPARSPGPFGGTSRKGEAEPRSLFVIMVMIMLMAITTINQAASPNPELHPHSVDLEPEDVMVDSFFWRDPEEIMQQDGQDLKSSP